MPNKCFCSGCKTGYKRDDRIRKEEGKRSLSLFSVPKDPYLFELWKKAIPRADRQLGPKDYICEKHFKGEDIDKVFETKLPDGTVFRLFRQTKKLRPGSIPCIFPNTPGHSTFVGNKLTKPKKNCVKRKKKSNLSETQREPKKAKIPCLDNATKKKTVSSLQTGKENVLLEVITVHPTPAKPSTAQQSLLKNKQNAEKVSNPLLSDSQNYDMSAPESPTSVCSSPAPDEISEDYSQQSSCDEIVTASPTPDKLTEKHSVQNSCNQMLTKFFSTLDKPKKTYSKQNCYVAESQVSNAVTENNSDQSICNLTLSQSTTLDTLPANDSNQRNYDKTLTEFSTANELIEDYSNQSICDENESESNNISPESVVVDQMSFDLLKANANMFETANSWWVVNAFDDFIVFSRWTSDYTVERRIVITKDLSVKVYLKDKETAIGRDLKELSVYDITKLIHKVENLKICSGIDYKDRNCTGYLCAENIFMCRRYNLCLNCIKWTKEEKKKAVQLLKESENCVELLNFNLI